MQYHDERIMSTYVVRLSVWCKVDVLWSYKLGYVESKIYYTNNYLSVFGLCTSHLSHLVHRQRPEIWGGIEVGKGLRPENRVCCYK